MNLAPLDKLPHVFWQTGTELWTHLRGRLQEKLKAGKRRREQVRTREDLEAYRAEVRAFFLQALGGLPEAPAGPPPWVEAGIIERSNYTIRKLLIEPRPGVRMPAHLYLPPQGGAPLPAIALFCGHGLAAKNGGYQNVCQVLVQAGFMVLITDPLGQGERCAYRDVDEIPGGTAEHEYCGNQCRAHGHNLMRYMLHDALRAIDYLAAHPRVDANAIGATGSSGGGMLTAILMLADPRVAAAAPCSFLSAREAIFDTGFWQDAEQTWPGFSGAGYDHVDFLAAFAPKPLAVLAATYDYYPIEGTRETVAQARRFWEMHGRADRLELVEAPRIHGMGGALVEAAVRFFTRHLLGTEMDSTPPVVDPLPQETLRCTREGSVFAGEQGSRTLFEENRNAFKHHRAPDREAAVRFLRQAVRQHREPVAANLRIVATGELEGCRYQGGFWRGQRAMHLSGILLRPGRAGSLPLTVALWEGGTHAISRHAGLIGEALSGGSAVLVLNLSGMGPLAPAPFNRAALDARDGTFSRINDDLATLGDSLAAMRVYDLLQSLTTLPEWGGLKTEGPIRLCLHGRTGIYGALASVLEPRLEIATWEEPPPSYTEIITSRFYDARDAKSYLMPGLLPFADWSDLVCIPSR